MKLLSLLILLGAKLQKLLPLWALLGLAIATAPVNLTPIELPGDELFWKIAYGLFLLSSFAALQPTSSRWLAQRFSWFVRQRPPVGWWWFDAILFTYTVIALLQVVIPLPRPEDSSLSHLGGFPSGHQVSAFALSWFLWRTVPNLSPLWFALAVLIGWSRVVTQDHYPYQVVTGGLVGLVLGWASERSAEGVLLPRFWNQLKYRWLRWKERGVR